jgi:hypothetical protein
MPIVKNWAIRTYKFVDDYGLIGLYQGIDDLVKIYEM